MYPVAVATYKVEDQEHIAALFGNIWLGGLDVQSVAHDGLVDVYYHLPEGKADIKPVGAVSFRIIEGVQGE